MLLLVIMLALFLSVGLLAHEYDRGLQQKLFAAITVVIVLVYAQGIF